MENRNTFKGSNGREFYWSNCDNPAGRIPMCVQHQSWPCKDCGTNHYEGCTCAFCDPHGKANVEPIPLMDETINTQLKLTLSQRQRASELEGAIGTDEYAAAAEIIVLRDALERAAGTDHGHRYMCSAARGMESDCTCGWLEISELVKRYARETP